MLFGFYLPKNFDSPYKATNAGNFWKRWHISLSRWLQDYLYIPLGGNRNASFGTYAVIITIAAIAAVLSGSIFAGLAIIVLVAIVWLLMLFLPEKKKKITTNLNMMSTMLLGGLWHGASWNFMIWGGLNGFGMLIYKFWKDKNLYVRAAILVLGTLTFGALHITTDFPVFTIAFVWVAVICAGTLIRLFYNIAGGKLQFAWLETAWAVAQTFAFITFTRLFFRSGSNLNPAEANQTAWNTATNMVAKIGGKWDFSLIGTMLYEYRNIFFLFALGMIIHWLPENFKRRYRLWFATMPLLIMVAVVVFAIFVIYQFISADLQTFIYFQF
jgi:D-alanyl-lipoteichoic acid acyltransferase DltB (MBOAT superfamily)